MTERAKMMRCTEDLRLFTVGKYAKVLLRLRNKIILNNCRFLLWAVCFIRQVEIVLRLFSRVAHCMSLQSYKNNLVKVIRLIHASM
jgi:hypothetical protein